jgi:hypothetical protein
MIEAYFLQIETIIQAFPDIRFISLTANSNLKCNRF